MNCGAESGEGMSHSMNPARKSDPVRLPDTFGRRQAKASLPGPTSDFALGEQIWEVIVKGHGSVKAAAYSMGNTDPSLLRRQILDGTLPLKKLLEADPKALAAFGEFLREHFGHATKSKAQIAREKLPELLATILEAVAEAERRE